MPEGLAPKLKTDLAAHGRVISLLSAAWEAYVREFPQGKYTETICQHICMIRYHIEEIQQLVLLEDS